MDSHLGSHSGSHPERACGGWVVMGAPTPAHAMVIATSRSRMPQETVGRSQDCPAKHPAYLHRYCMQSHTGRQEGEPGAFSLLLCLAATEHMPPSSLSACFS